MKSEAPALLTLAEPVSVSLAVLVVLQVLLLVEAGVLTVEEGVGEGVDAVLVSVGGRPGDRECLAALQGVEVSFSEGLDRPAVPALRGRVVEAD